MPVEHDFAMPGAISSSGLDSHGQKMTNEDFRKLMMTPRSSGPASLASGSSLGSGVAAPAHSATPKADKHESSDKAEKRKKKKSYYAKLKRQEDDKMAELAAKYRDRAQERREGGVDSRSDESAGAYRAVAPDVKGNYDAAERRRQMIQESKFLGGDMEHTHLVKGLDFALLQKVRSEIIHREKVKDPIDETEDDPEEEEPQGKSKKGKKKATAEKAVPVAKEDSKEAVKVEKDDNKIICKSILAKNIVRTVFNTDVQEKNELFFPGRMAYIVELEEDLAESSNVSDIPTTMIRSKADVQGMSTQQQLSLSTNDIVINKLTQILSYLRAGNRSKKKKKDKSSNDFIEKSYETKKDINPKEDLPIYDDVGDYVPSTKRDSRDHRSRHDDRSRSKYDRSRRSRSRSRDRHHHDHNRSNKHHDDSKSRGSKYFDREDHRQDDIHTGYSGEDKELLKKLIRREEEKSRKEEEKKIGAALKEPDHYAECYPGMSEMNDAIDDSDEEADYTKMDLGNKKGPIGRWDFDTAEEYAEYMSRKEALPKAAFQYGVKMNEGRKTRGKVGGKNDKAKLDKEWNKISALIDKRKTGGSSGGGSAAKMAKFE